MKKLTLTLFFLCCAIQTYCSSQREIPTLHELAFKTLESLLVKKTITELIDTQYDDENDKQKKIDFLEVIAAHGPHVFEKFINTSIDANNTTWLHTAIKKNKLEVISLLINANADVNQQDPDGRTSLHYAAEYNSSEAISLLIDAGADIHKKDNEGNTPLHFAVLHEADKAIQLLIDAGADVTIKNHKLKTSRKLIKMTETFVLFDQAIATRQLKQKSAKDAITKLINNQYDDENDKQKKIDSLKVIAARSPHLFKKFINASIDPNNTTWLHTAIKKNNLEVISLLIDAGANVHQQDTTAHGDTPLHYAAEYNFSEIIALLIDAGALVNQQNNFKNTPLHYACLRKNSGKVIQLLINANAHVHQQNIHGWTPLHCAASKNTKNPIQLLVAAGADVNQQNIHGRTPLHTAALYNANKAIASRF